MKNPTNASNPDATNAPIPWVNGGYVGVPIDIDNNLPMDLLDRIEQRLVSKFAEYLDTIEDELLAENPELSNVVRFLKPTMVGA